MTEQQTPKYNCYSSGGEMFLDGDLSEAIRNLDLQPGDKVHRGISLPVTADDLIPPADWVIDDIACRAGDLVGEIAEDYPEVSNEARQELESLLRGWVEKHCPPTFFMVDDSIEYVVTEADMAAAHLDRLAETGND